MTKTIWRIPTWIRKIWPWSRPSSTETPAEPDADAVETREAETEPVSDTEPDADALETRKAETEPVSDTEPDADAPETREVETKAVNDTKPDADAPETGEAETEAGTSKDTQANANEQAGRSHATFSLSDLEVGQTIVVRTAGKSAQKAEVVATAQPSKRGAFVKVRKYQSETDSWTRPSRCYPEQIVEPPIAAGD